MAKKVAAAKAAPSTSTGKKKKPYSMEFRANPGTTPRRYLLSGIPPGLWIAFSARAKREHIAKRQVLLKAVEAWTKRPEGEA